MSTKYHKIRVATKICQRICKKFFTKLNKQVIWLLRIIFRSSRTQETGNAGFVLPVVVLVSLVVVLVTTAILFRSFDRAKNASNVRVDEVLVNAAMPAVDRARSKLAQLLADPALPRSTPTDISLYSIIKNNTKYNFGDETRLELAYDINGNGTIDNTNSTATGYQLENDESWNAGWKFPVDTDNDGKFDTFTLYAIYFRSPLRNTTTNLFSRVRIPLDARTPPMSNSNVGSSCTLASGTSANLVGDSSWYKTNNGNLAKSFYVYVANVPITSLGNLSSSNYETKSARGFSSLEFEQDRFLTPVNNQAVWFENDLEISPGSILNLNGSIHTNSNLLAGGQYADKNIVFRQVSSIYSCYYAQANAKISIGGNFSTGNVSQTKDKFNIQVDLFQGNENNVTSVNIGGSTGYKSTTSSGGYQVGYNDAAYNERINLMTTQALSYCTYNGSLCGSNSNLTTMTIAQLTTTVNAISQYPSDITSYYNSNVTNAANVTAAYNYLSTGIQLYFTNHTRRVPFAEAKSPILASNDPTALTTNGTTYSASNVFTSGGQIDVPQLWRDISTSNTNLTLNTGLSGNKADLPATNPEQLVIDQIENYTGDRISTGNNLAAYWKDTANSTSYTNAKTQTVDSTSSGVSSGPTYWDKTYPALPKALRTRTTQVQESLDLGVTDRNDFWEISAANSTDSSSNTGGMRIVTGAGIYVDDSMSGGDPSAVFPRATNSFLPTPSSLDTTFVGSLPTNGNVVSSTNTSTLGKMPVPPTFSLDNTTSNIYVWPDTMPMSYYPNLSSTPSSLKGDLLMRATAVYHYADNAGTAQTPIACISSYYDPTNSTTANNGKDSAGNNLPWHYVAGGRSNNGIVYDFPGRTITTAIAKTLNRQSMLVFPNGRLANSPLRTAMQNYANGGFSTYADYSAVDTALCAIAILNGTATQDTSKIAHGEIREGSFLDAREVKALQNVSDYTTPGAQGTIQGQGAYGLPLEQRQPLEIRTTDIDLTYLASTKLSTNTSEYLLPESGIIYATRDDALPDVSYETIDNTVSIDNTSTANTVLTLSQTDFKLDPTRRPNAIRLIPPISNSTKPTILARGGSNGTYNQLEKGLILVTNLPTYIKGDFNKHLNSSGTTIYEFTDTSNSFYAQKVASPYFACRQGRTGCPTSDGDTWRPATILSDAITLLSTGFQDGYRSTGDYDLNYNNLSIPSTTTTTTTNFTIPGTNLVNNLVTNANWWTPSTNNTGSSAGVTNTTLIPSNTNPQTSYNSNGVTPIQRRDNFSVYLMESCLQVNINTYTICDPNDPTKWTIDNGSGAPGVLAANLTLNSMLPTNSFSGTTASTTHNPNYLRRVAFKRNSDNTLATNPDGSPIPLGIDNTGKIQAYSNGTYPPTANNALWFKTNSGTTASPKDDYGNSNPLYMTKSGYQVRLVPITQIFIPDAKPNAGSSPPTSSNTNPGLQQYWIQTAVAQSGTNSTVTFNAGFTTGNSPSRYDGTNKYNYEESAGLQSFVRLLENWNNITLYARGSFIQFQRSSYATGPFAPIILGQIDNTSSVGTTITPTNTTGNNNSFFNLPYYAYWTNKGNADYNTNGQNPLPGTTSYYVPPTRDWGFDVALLSQQPDLFAQRFTVPPSTPPVEYFREVNSDDAFLQTLLCAKQQSTTGGAFDTSAVPINYQTNCPTVSYPLPQ